MSFHNPSGITAVIFLASLTCVNISDAYGQEGNGYTNLQVLDPDITREELGMAMLQNTLGLGLPRRQREGCLFCHVGDMDLPVDEWDFAADDKETKLKARAMMAMVKDINTNHLSQLDNRLDESFSVSCTTCHSGRTDPRPLPDVLRAIYASDGISAAISKYHELRDRYLIAGAYDFRPAVLVRLANRLAQQGAWDDSLALAVVNEEANPAEPFAASARLSLQIERQINRHNVADALAYFDRERGKEGRGLSVTRSSMDWAGTFIGRTASMRPCRSFAEILRCIRANTFPTKASETRSGSPTTKRVASPYLKPGSG